MPAMMLSLYNLNLMARLGILSGASLTVFLPARLRRTFIVCNRRKLPAVQSMPKSLIISCILGPPVCS